MNQRIYKSSATKFIWNIILSIFGIVVAMVVSSFFLDDTKTYIVGAVVGFLFLLMIISDSRLTVSVNDEYVIFKKGKKEKKFEIAKYSFGYSTRNRDSYRIIVMDESGEKQEIDCSGLSYGNFEKLAEDLGIIGEKSEVTKLN